MGNSAIDERGGGEGGGSADSEGCDGELHGVNKYRKKKIMGCLSAISSLVKEVMDQRTKARRERKKIYLAAIGCCGWCDVARGS